MNKFFVLVAMVTMMVSYQNCSNSMSFDASEQLVAKVGEEDDSNTYDGVIDEIADSMPTPAQPLPEGPVAQPPRVPDTRYPPIARDPDHDDDDHDHDRDGRHDHDDKDCDKKKDKDKDYADDDEKSSNAKYVCVLDGPGKSIRLGLSSAGLSDNTSTVNDICMSKRACEEVVSKAYTVKSAEKRGYCGDSNRADIVQMSDAQVDEAIAQELLKRMMSSN